MRFADLDGSLIDVYQENTNMTDESGQSYPATVDALLDNARRAARLLRRVRHEHPQRLHRPAARRRGDRRLGAVARRAADLLQAAARLDRRAQRLDDPRPELERRDVHLRHHRRRRGERSPDAPPDAGPDRDAERADLRQASPRSYTVQTIKGIQYAMFDTITGTCQATYS